MYLKTENVFPPYLRLTLGRWPVQSRVILYNLNAVSVFAAIFGLKFICVRKLSFVYVCLCLFQVHSRSSMAISLTLFFPFLHRNIYPGRARPHPSVLTPNPP